MEFRIGLSVETVNYFLVYAHLFFVSYTQRWRIQESSYGEEPIAIQNKT